MTSRWSTRIAVLAAVLAVVATVVYRSAKRRSAVVAEPLLLAVEVRLAAGDTIGRAEVLAIGVTGADGRSPLEGRLFDDLVRREDGQWVIPGVVGIGGGRGARGLEVQVGGTTYRSTLPSLTDHPDSTDRPWSDWISFDRPAPSAGAAAVRIRVVSRREPIRVDRIGQFEVATSMRALLPFGPAGRLAALSRFSVRHRGIPLVEPSALLAVSAIRGPVAALLIASADSSGAVTCRLVSDRSGNLETVPVASCDAATHGQPLTADSVRHREAADRFVVPGWIDFRTFAIPGLYRVGQAVLDTRDLTIKGYTEPADPPPLVGLPPLSVSPDQRSFAWFAEKLSEDNPFVGVTDWRSDSSYAVPIDRPRMRFFDAREIGPAWVARHFSWTRGPDGVDRLRAKPNIRPLPYRGRLTIGQPGGYLGYSVRPGTAALRQALVDWLVAEWHAERVADELDGYAMVLKVEGTIVRATLLESTGLVSLELDRKSGDPRLMKRIGARVDAVLASGKYDKLFRGGR